jgi:hypothetical protein
VFTGDYNINVMTASEAMVHNGQQAVCIRWKIYSYYLSLLVNNMVYETRILVREAVMILTPDMRRKYVI